ncbi:MAG: hypothetical protein WCK67_02455 [bacterium]
MTKINGYNRPPIYAKPKQPPTEIKTEKQPVKGIKYTEIDPQTGKFSIALGLKFCKENILRLYKDKDGDGKITPKDIGLLGFILDFNKNGKLDPEEKLTHFMFEDSTETLDGTVTVNEIKKSSNIIKRDLLFAMDRLKKLYDGNNLSAKGKEFETTEDAANIAEKTQEKA